LGTPFTGKKALADPAAGVIRVEGNRTKRKDTQSKKALCGMLRGGSRSGRIHKGDGGKKKQGRSLKGEVCGLLLWGVGKGEKKVLKEKDESFSASALAKPRKRRPREHSSLMGIERRSKLNQMSLMAEKKPPKTKKKNG